jgi:hypothetical protein
MPLSVNGNIQANAISSPVAWLALLTFTLPGRDPLRIVNNTEDVMSRGNTFIASGFEFILPNDDGESMPQVKLTIPNVDRNIIEWIRGFPTAPTLMLEIVLSNAPNVVERSIDWMRLSNVTYDALQITGTLIVEDVLSAGFPSESYSPVRFPGLIV